VGRPKLKQPWSSRQQTNRAVEPPFFPTDDSADDDNEGVFQLLYERQPELAESETRALTFLESEGDIPSGEYSFAEAFCAGANCDCRRAMFFVYRRDLGAERSTPEHVTTIGYGWEPLSFYVKWMFGDREGAKFARGPIIEPNSPNAGYGYAQQLLKAFEGTCLSSPDYVARVRRHYELFKRG
jgi:hypothetical protein